jgi:hypothetical protein
MSPEELAHFADLIAMIGVYEGLWPPGGSDIVGLRVRLDDGTPAVVVGRCDAWPEPEPWAERVRYIYAAHIHRTDTLRWMHDRVVHTQPCAAARA